MPLTTEQRQALVTRGGELHRLALRESRKLTTAEQAELNQIEAQLDQSEYRQIHGDDAQRRFASSVEFRTKRDLRPGEIRTYRKDEKIADDFKPYDGPGLGMYLRGVALGKWDHAEELRAMAEGSLGGGGYLVPTPLSLTLIDLMRNQAQVIRAGAVTVPMESSTLKMARLASDIQGAWKAENAPITYNDATFQQVLFTAHTLVAAAKISVELLEDSAPSIDSVVSNSIAKSMALALDYACLYGDGSTNNPVGVKNQSGVTLTPLNYSFSTMGMTNYVAWNVFSVGIATLLGNNFPGPFGAIYNGRTAGDIDTLRDTLGQPMRKPPLVQDLQMFVSNQIPNNFSGGSPVASDCTDVFLGQWDQLMIGMRTSLAMEVSRVAGDSTGSAFTNLQVWVRAYLRADVQLAHPAAFQVLTQIPPAPSIY